MPALLEHPERKATLVKEDESRTPLNNGIIPIAVVTGFLGSGKSTLINRLLAAGALSDVAFIVNEFGEVPIDHMLIDAPSEAIAILHSGCLCCAVRDNLTQTLQRLFMRRIRGLIRPFRLVVLETSGLDSPAPVLQTLLTRGVIEMNYQFSSVATIVDVINAQAILATEPEALAQVAVADILVLSKTDLLEGASPCSTVDLVRKINASAPIRLSSEIANDPELLLNHFWQLGDDAADSPLPDERSSRRRQSAGSMSAHAHGHGIGSLAYSFAAPIDWDELNRCLRKLTRVYGDKILRIKGIVAINGIDQTVVLHGVRSTLYPPELLKHRAAQQQSGHLVIIGRELPQAEFDAELTPLIAIAGTPQAAVKKMSEGFQL